MAWELGAAVALNKKIFPCLALGLPSNQLPLLQYGLLVRDLGRQADLSAFICEIGYEFQFNNPIANDYAAEAMKFYSLQSNNVISIRVANQYYIVENLSKETMNEIDYYGDEVIVAAIHDVTQLLPEQRCVFQVHGKAPSISSFETISVGPALGRVLFVRQSMS